MGAPCARPWSALKHTYERVGDRWRRKAKKQRVAAIPKGNGRRMRNAREQAGRFRGVVNRPALVG